MNLTQLNLKAQKLSDIVHTEPKIGIGRSDLTHSSDESRLYRVGMRHSKNLKIVVDFEGIELAPEGFMKLGGENKAVAYRQPGKKVRLPVKKPKINGKQFKLYLATPAVFEKFWIPDLDKYGKQGIKLKLLTAVIGKPLFIGGFDMKGKQPKSMRKAVPAGSVYYFEIENGDMQRATDIFHGQSVSELKTANEGIGISYVGGIKE